MSRDTVHRCLGASFTLGWWVGSPGWGRVRSRGAVACSTSSAAPGRALRAHVLAAATDEALDRRSILVTLDEPAPALVTDPAHFEDLADRYDAAYPTAAPVAMMTALQTHLRAVSAGSRKPRPRADASASPATAPASPSSPAERPDNPTAARAFFATAYDDALETGEHPVAAIARGYTASSPLRPANTWPLSTTSAPPPHL
jgi:hypothetical protein